MTLVGLGDGAVRYDFQPHPGSADGWYTYREVDDGVPYVFKGPKGFTKPSKPAVLWDAIVAGPSPPRYSRWSIADCSTACQSPAGATGATAG